MNFVEKMHSYTVVWSTDQMTLVLAVVSYVEGDPLAFHSIDSILRRLEMHRRFTNNSFLVHHFLQ